MEPAAILALKRRSVWRLHALHWSSLIAGAALVVYMAARDGSYIELLALLPVAALALLGPGRPVRSPDFWFRKAALVAFISLMAFNLKSWILLILVAGILVEGIRSWRNLGHRECGVEERG